MRVGCEEASVNGLLAPLRSKKHKVVYGEALSEAPAFVACGNFRGGQLVKEKWIQAAIGVCNCVSWRIFMFHILDCFGDLGTVCSYLYALCRF